MFRRILSTLAVTTLAATLCSVTLSAPDADAAAKPRVFANCAQMNRVHPHGVGKVGAHDHGAGKAFRPVTNFARSNALYTANIARDKDRDGIACEKH